MNIKNILKSMPIEPEIECDGGYYTKCGRCMEEITPFETVCPYCGQIQDWSWLKKEDTHEED